MLMMMRMRGLRENKTGAVLFASAVTGARVDGRAQVGRMRRAGNRRSSRGACGSTARFLSDSVRDRGKTGEIASDDSSGAGGRW
ncbi:hypothetical protein F5B18DRAFT_654135 [Nemania serpens]|nr:hypothetical protein F5B18DRAFT_654135 [Nemania serpens]